MNEQKAILKQHVGYWINRLRQSVHYAFEERLAKYDISIASWCVLLAIYDGSASSINELSRFIEVDKASISRIVARLVKDCYLVHGQGDDKRSGNITITQKGKDIIPKLILEAEQNEENFFGFLDISELIALQGAIRSILTHATNVKCDGWLTKDLKKESIMKNVEAIIKISKAERWPYPRIFETLKENGIKFYIVKLGQEYYASYVGEFGEYLEPAPLEYTPLSPSGTFNADGVIAAINRSIAKEITYVEFLESIASSGVTHYKVDMEKRRITYFNKDESQYHTETIPVF